MDERAYDAWRRDAVGRLLMAVAMLIALFSIGMAGVLLREVLLRLPRSVVPLVALLIPVGWVAIARVLLIRCPVCACRGLSLDQRATGRGHRLQREHVEQCVGGDADGAQQCELQPLAP